MKRIERDSMGEIEIEENALWGAQTQRSLLNFNIGKDTMPMELVKAIVVVKQACSKANYKMNILPESKFNAIYQACEEILEGKFDNQFPLSVWQTGSGTQTNMNVNEVIANIVKLNGVETVHPNDDVNLSQSSNDVFPSSINIAILLNVKNNLMNELKLLIEEFKVIESQNIDVLKIGRTHLQDATPITFAEEISGWWSSLQSDFEIIEVAVKRLEKLALGGTAVGNGINCPKGFDKQVCEEISKLLGENFEPVKNKFSALSSKNDVVNIHSGLKILACDLMKIANDIRWLASGPRCGLGELTIPENEPGSSIMPGKVNPTQCEAVTMVAVQVIANDVAVSMSATQGNFELNVFMPVIILNCIQSINLLTDVMRSFRTNCVCGIKANKEKMKNNVDRSLMLVTLFSPTIGYEKSVKVAKFAFENNMTLKDACLNLDYLSEGEIDLILGKI